MHNIGTVQPISDLFLGLTVADVSCHRCRRTIQILRLQLHVVDGMASNLTYTSNIELVEWISILRSLFSISFEHAHLGLEETWNVYVHLAWGLNEQILNVQT